MGRAFVVTLLAATVVAAFLRGICESIDDWFPMRVGDRWTYRDTWDKDRPIVFEVVAEEGELFRVERRIAGETVRFWLSVDARGVVVHRTSIAAFAPPFEEFRLPSVPGAAWTYRGSFGTLEVDIRSCVVSRSGSRCEIREEASHAGETAFVLEKGKGIISLGGKARDPHRKEAGNAWSWELVSFERRR